MKNGPERNIPWLTTEYFENRQKFPPEELAKYAGKHIAWSWDGTTILASGDSMNEVEERLRSQGIDPGHVVGDYVNPPDLVLLGSLGVFQ